jgi:hypothetical protein
MRTNISAFRYLLQLTDIPESPAGDAFLKSCHQHSTPSPIPPFLLPLTIYVVTINKYRCQRKDYNRRARSVDKLPECYDIKISVAALTVYV